MDKQEALKAYFKLAEALEGRKRHFGLEAYVPNKLQDKAHRSKAKTILFCGGNRSGKSTLGAAEIAMAVTRQYPSWFPKERRFSKPVKCMISATEFPVVTRVIEPKLMSMIPTDYIRKVQRSAMGYANRIYCVDGSTIDVLTQEMKNEAYESADWDIVWLDEPQSQRKYSAIRRGLVDRQGLCLCTFTPITEPWMKEELVDKSDGKRIEVFTVDIRDNMFDVEGNPILNKTAIDEFIAQIPEDEIDSRAHGKFFHIKGMVYKEFGQDHLLDFKYEYPDPVICILDPHDRIPHHVIWAFIDRNDDIFVDYEAVIHAELPDLAKQIVNIEKARGYYMRKRIIDPNFGRKPYKPGSNISVSRELGRNHCSFYDSVNDDIDLGHMIVREYLHYDHNREVTAFNKPKLFFSRERCTETIKSMRNHQFPEWKGPTGEERDPKEGQKEKEAHGADCVRYLCVTRPKFKSAIVREYEGSYQAAY